VLCALSNAVAWGTDACFLEIFQRGRGLILLVIMALGPEKWQPRTGLGWKFDHFFGYFVITTFVCVAWPRPLVVGGALMVFGSVLEGLQAFTPDRTANLTAAIYGASGALAAALLAELFMRVFSNKVGKSGQGIFRKRQSTGSVQAAILTRREISKR
jgi:VanZ family protein